MEGALDIDGRLERPGTTNAVDGQAEILVAGREPGVYPRADILDRAGVGIIPEVCECLGAAQAECSVVGEARRCAQPEVPAVQEERAAGDAQVACEREVGCQALGAAGIAAERGVRDGPARLRDRGIAAIEGDILQCSVGMLEIAAHEECAGADHGTAVVVVAGRCERARPHIDCRAVLDDEVSGVHVAAGLVVEVVGEVQARISGRGVVSGQTEQDIGVGQAAFGLAEGAIGDRPRSLVPDDDSVAVEVEVRRAGIRGDCDRVGLNGVTVDVDENSVTSEQRDVRECIATVRLGNCRAGEFAVHCQLDRFPSTGRGRAAVAVQRASPVHIGNRELPVDVVPAISRLHGTDGLGTDVVRVLDVHERDIARALRIDVPLRAFGGAAQNDGIPVCTGQIERVRDCLRVAGFERELFAGCGTGEVVERGRSGNR